MSFVNNGEKEYKTKINEDNFNLLMELEKEYADETNSEFGCSLKPNNFCVHRSGTRGPCHVLVEKKHKIEKIVGYTDL